MTQSQFTSPPPVSGTSERPSKRAKREEAQSSVKETVESILVAFILAFIFRAFLVEAFVIPTGSMAPTLLGHTCAFVAATAGIASTPTTARCRRPAAT